MPNANFNTQIVSSSNDEVLEYNLDVVITKDFITNSSYQYTLIGSFPNGVSIESRFNDGTYLTINPYLEFDLTINVFNGNKLNPISAITSTRVTIDGTLSFSNEVNKFLENPNYIQNKELVVENWLSIISNRISSGDLVDGPDMPI